MEWTSPKTLSRSKRERERERERERGVIEHMLIYVHTYMCHYWYTTIMNYRQVASGVYMYVYNICMVYVPVLVYNYS